jgi:cellulose synthase/poly-beta-1,6-N-acetylglucosamine synthase-like glycosyltransferase
MNRIERKSVLVDLASIAVFNQDGWYRRGYRDGQKKDRVKIQEYYNFWMNEFGGDNLNVTDQKGRTPLIHAIATADMELMKELINYGVPLHHCDNEGKDALWYLCHYLRTDMMDVFLKETMIRNRSFDMTCSRKNKISFRNGIDYLKVVVKGNKKLYENHTDPTRLASFVDSRLWGIDMFIDSENLLNSWIENTSIKNINQLRARQKQCVQLLFEFGYEHPDIEKSIDESTQGIKFNIMGEINRMERQKNWNHWKKIIFAGYVCINIVVFFGLMILINVINSLISPFLIVFSFHLIIKIWVAVFNWIGSDVAIDYHKDRGLCVFVPIYREKAESLIKTIQTIHISVKALKLTGPVRLIMVLDGYDKDTMATLKSIFNFNHSDGQKETRLELNLLGSPHDYIKIFTGVSRSGDHMLNYDLLVKESNVGKRDSQLMFIQYLHKRYEDMFQYILFIDSDIRLNENSIKKMFAFLDTRPETMAVCGTTEVETLNQNLLSRYQRYEYRMFHVIGKGFENSGINGYVTCLPGCFSLYRAEVFDEERYKSYAQNPLSVADTSRVYWYKQIFNTNLLNLGEDRYFTTLLIMKGLKNPDKNTISYIKGATAYTVCPSTPSDFIKQRRRWHNSTLVNLTKLVFNLDMMRCRPLLWYSTCLDFFGMLIAPASITFFIFLVTFVITNVDGVSSVTIISILLVMLSYIINFFIIWSTLGASPLDFATHMLLFPMMHIFLPLYSLWHIDNASWGTRQKTNSSADDREISLGIFLSYLFVGIWVWIMIVYLYCEREFMCGLYGQIVFPIIIGFVVFVGATEFFAVSKPKPTAIRETTNTSHNNDENNDEMEQLPEQVSPVVIPSSFKLNIKSRGIVPHLDAEKDDLEKGDDSIEDVKLDNSRTEPSPSSKTVTVLMVQPKRRPT